MPKSKRKAAKKDLDVCVICEREMLQDNYCEYHVKAYTNIMEAFDDWQEGYGELSFVEYLQKIIENPATGVWAKEVAEDLLKKENSEK